MLSVTLDRSAEADPPPNWASPPTPTEVEMLVVLAAVAGSLAISSSTRPKTSSETSSERSMVVPTGASAVIRIWFGSVVGKNSTPVGATKKSAITPTSVPSVAVSRRARLSVSSRYGEPKLVCRWLRPPKIVPRKPNPAIRIGSRNMPMMTSMPLMLDRSIRPDTISGTSSTATMPPNQSPALTLAAPPRNAVSRLWTMMPSTPMISRTPPGAISKKPAGAAAAFSAAPAISSTKPPEKAPSANVLRSRPRRIE